VQVDFNRRAFLWGRRAAHNPAAVEAVIGAAPKPSAACTLDDIVARRVEFLTAYQDAAYARRYRERVERVRNAEARRIPSRGDLAEAVARNLFRLMAIKDEYEVARLWTDGSFLRQIGQEFERWDALELHLAPPLLAERDPITGRQKKRRYGPWMLHAMRLLAGLKRLRGTALDPFGRTAERRMERRLRAEYEALVDTLIERVDADNHATAVALARVPEQIRGFGHVKEASVRCAKGAEAELLERWRVGEPALQAAE
jgi:indolepyruvate ferredoxin oxidoreductase